MGSSIMPLFRHFMKRSMDLLLILMGSPLLLPVFILTWIMVKKKLGTPVLFIQTRPGKNGRPFRMYKFRSMTDQKDENGNLLPDEVRLTAFGKKLRSTSLDELPEVLNVLRGEMSLVGPRPLLMEYLPRYSKEQFRRHEALPGITGLAQISGRNELEWSKRFELDVYYVDHQTLWLDLQILFKTILKVIKKDGISSKTAATMEEFKG